MFDSKPALTRRDYENALMVSNAPNILGISKTYSAVLDKIWSERKWDMHGVGIHPIARLYIGQFMLLSNVAMLDTDIYMRCEAVCKDNIERLTKLEGLHAGSELPFLEWLEGKWKELKDADHSDPVIQERCKLYGFVPQPKY